MSDELSPRDLLLSVLSDDDVEALLEVVEAAPSRQAVRVPGESEEDFAERADALDTARLNHEYLLSAADLDALRAELELNKQRWAENFGRGALASGKEVDQREVDYRRGYYEGATHYLVRLPVATRARLVKRAKREGGEA